MGKKWNTLKVENSSNNSVTQKNITNINWKGKYSCCKNIHGMLHENYQTHILLLPTMRFLESIFRWTFCCPEFREKIQFSSFGLHNLSLYFRITQISFMIHVLIAWYHKTCHSAMFHFMKKLFLNINWKCNLTNKIRALIIFW